MASNSTENSRTLRSRCPTGDKKQTRSQSLSQSSTVSKYVAKNYTSLLPSQSRFKSKLTDTLKIKLIAQRPHQSDAKKSSRHPQHPVKKKVPKAQDAIPTVTIDTKTSNVTTLTSPNGLVMMNNHHIPKSYMLYIGNLPLDVTKEQLADHFRKTCRGGVKSIRIPKEKGTEKGRGYAYMEFQDRISHGIALRLHQTKLGSRRITVEFTQVGGKKKDKLKRRIRALTKSISSLERT